MLVPQTSQVLWANEPSRCVSSTFSSLRSASYSVLQFVQVAVHISNLGSKPRLVILIVPVLEPVGVFLSLLDPRDELPQVSLYAPPEGEHAESASAQGLVALLGQPPQDHHAGDGREEAEGHSQEHVPAGQCGLGDVPHGALYRVYTVAGNIRETSFFMSRPRMYADTR